MNTQLQNIDANFFAVRNLLL